jgi:transposase
LEPEEQEVLEPPFKCPRDLRKAYASREKLTKIFDMKQAQEVTRGAVQDWIAEVKRSDLECFAKFIATLKEHVEIITNYFPQRSNSRWVEGSNDEIKALKRRCYGLPIRLVPSAASGWT